MYMTFDDSVKLFDAHYNEESEQVTMNFSWKEHTYSKTDFSDFILKSGIMDRAEEDYKDILYDILLHADGSTDTIKHVIKAFDMGLFAETVRELVHMYGRDLDAFDVAVNIIAEEEFGGFDAVSSIKNLGESNLHLLNQYYWLVPCKNAGSAGDFSEYLATRNFSEYLEVSSKEKTELEKINSIMNHVVCPLAYSVDCDYSNDYPLENCRELHKCDKCNECNEAAEYRQYLERSMWGKICQLDSRRVALEEKIADNNMHVVFPKYLEELIPEVKLHLQIAEKEAQLAELQEELSVLKATRTSHEDMYDEDYEKDYEEDDDEF